MMRRCESYQSCFCMERRAKVETLANRPAVLATKAKSVYGTASQVQALPAPLPP